MKIFNLIIRILLYLSIGFVIYYLAHFDFLVFDKIQINRGYAFGAIIVLWSGFIVSALSWKVSLKAHGIAITSREAIHSHGISVFGKYLPGKIWVILGRASIIQKKGYPLPTLSAISLKEQLMYLLLGFVVSFFILPFVTMNIWLKIIVVLTASGLALFLFCKPIYQFVINLLSRVVKKTIEIPFIHVKQAWKFSYIILIYWFLWSIGFYLLCKSMVPEASVIVAFAFPISVCYGLVAVFVPGGIGIREGIIVAFLVSVGFEPSIAITISVIQRLWFITGEVFIFLTAFMVRKNGKAHS